MDASLNRRPAPPPASTLCGRLRGEGSMPALGDTCGKYGREAAGRTGPSSHSPASFFPVEVISASRTGPDGGIAITKQSSGLGAIGTTGRRVRLRAAARGCRVHPREMLLRLPFSGKPTLEAMPWLTAACRGCPGKMPCVAISSP